MIFRLSFTKHFLPNEHYLLRESETLFSPKVKLNAKRSSRQSECLLDDEAFGGVISRLFRAVDDYCAASRATTVRNRDELAGRHRTPGIYWRYCSTLYNRPYSYVTSTGVETPRGKIAVVTKECVRGERTIENRLLLSGSLRDEYLAVCARTHVRMFMDMEVGQAH